jgi:hypothetical protein
VGTTQTFSVIILSDIIPGTYTLSFTTTETNPSSVGNFYLPLLPIALQVTQITSATTNLPTITV